jgi:hypothetical protein
MNLYTKNPTAGGASGLDKTSSLPGGIDCPSNAPKTAAAQAHIELNPRAVKEARLELLREAVHEACGFIQIHANVCQDLAEAGDNAGLIHSLGRLVIYTKHAAKIGNELRALRETPP